MINSSKNKKTYARFDFDNFSERGLQPFVRELSSAGAKVSTVTASNRKIRKDGLFTKKVEIYFDNSQRVKMIIGDVGDVISIHVNGKPTPFGEPKKTKDLANTLAKLMERGQEAFDRTLASRLKAVKIETAVKPISRSISGKIAQAEEAAEQARSNYKVVSTKLNHVQRELDDKQQAKNNKADSVLAVKSDIASLRKEIQTLESQL